MYMYMYMYVYVCYVDVYIHAHYVLYCTCTMYMYIHVRRWKVLVDNLMTQDKTTFRDLLTRLAPGLAPGLSNMFTTSEQVQPAELPW